MSEALGATVVYQKSPSPKVTINFLGLTDTNPQYTEDVRRRTELGLDTSDEIIKYAREHGVWEPHGVFLLPEELEFANARDEDYSKIKADIFFLIPENELYWGYVDQSKSVFVVGVPKNEILIKTKMYWRACPPAWLL